MGDTATLLRHPQVSLQSVTRTVTLCAEQILSQNGSTGVGVSIHAMGVFQSADQPRAGDLPINRKISLVGLFHGDRPEDLDAYWTRVPSRTDVRVLLEQVLPGPGTLAYHSLWLSEEGGSALAVASLTYFPEGAQVGQVFLDLVKTGGGWLRLFPYPDPHMLPHSPDRGKPSVDSPLPEDGLFDAFHNG